MIYVEQNPVRAGLVDHAGAWRWSSAAAHLKSAGDMWLDLSAWRLRFNPESWKRCLQLGLADAQTVERLREATRSGWPLGSDEFLDRLERDLHAKVRKAKPGPTPASLAAAPN